MKYSELPNGAILLDKKDGQIWFVIRCDGRIQCHTITDFKGNRLEKATMHDVTHDSEKVSYQVIIDIPSIIKKYYEV